MELLDIYNANRQKTGRIHRRGEKLGKGEYILVVCVWVSDGAGRILLTLRAPEKTASPNTWENSGGAAKMGETSRQAIARELWEETGIRAGEKEFLFLESDQIKDAFFDFYFLCHPVPLTEIVLQPGETSDAKWVTLAEMDEMVDSGVVAPPIAKRYLLHRQRLTQLVWQKGKNV